MRALGVLLFSLIVSAPVLSEDWTPGAIGPFGGLNNADSSLVIPSNQAQDLLNVDVTPGGRSVKKREGYAVAQTLSITTSPVHGAYSFYDADGNDVALAFNDRNVTSSIAGAAATVIYSTATTHATWQCVDSQGYAYCANNSRNGLFQTDGVSISPLTITTTGTIIAVTPERLVQAGFSTVPNRIDFSKANDFTTWTVGSEPTDPITFTITAPGSRITHLTYAHQRIYWFKENSFGYILEGAELADWEVKAISNEIGTRDNTSTQDTNGNLYFRGSDGNIYMTDGANVKKLSEDISGLISDVAPGLSFNSWTQTTTADWAAGSVSPTSAMTTSSNQMVLVGNPTETDTSTADFASGTVLTNIDTTTVSGQISRKWFTIDNWADGNYTASPPWTVDSGSAWSVTSGALRSAPSASAFECISSTFTQVTGTWEIAVRLVTNGSNASDAIKFWFMAGAFDATNNEYRSGYAIRISEAVGNFSADFLEYDGTGSASSIGTSAVVGTLDTSAHTVRVTRTAAGVMTLYWDGVATSVTATDTTVTSSSRVGLRAITGSAATWPVWDFDNFYYSPAIDGTGATSTSAAAFESRIFDNTAAFSTYRNFTATLSSATSETVNFFTNTSADGNTFDGWVFTSTGSTIDSTDRRYIKYKAEFKSLANSQNGYFSDAAKIQDVTLERTLNAGHRSQVKSASGMSAWDNFYPTTLESGGTLAFYIRSNPTSFDVTSATIVWTAVSAGAVPSISTGAYFQILSSITVTASGQNPAIYDYTQHWFEGTQTNQAWAAFHDERVYFAVIYGAGATENNRVLIYDLVTPGWTVYDWGSNGFYRRLGDLYFGSSTSGYVYKFGDVHSDAGSAINAYWKSKDFFMESPFLNKDFVNLSVAADAVNNSSMTVTYTTDGLTSTSYTMPLQSTKVFARNNKNLPLGTAGATFNVQFGNNAADQPFEVFAIEFGYRNKSWVPGN